MNNSLESLFKNILLGPDKIYSSIKNTDLAQSTEIKLREKVASQHYDNYLSAIANNHSVPVMDYEVKRFLAYLPKNALIPDIWGCLGWHW